MRVRSSKTAASWAELSFPNGDDELLEIGYSEAVRHFSQAVRSPNLAILSGLGTSLCVLNGSVRVAPTMDQLRNLVVEKFKELDEQSPLEDRSTRWETFKRLARVDDDHLNLEALLSKAKIASDFLGGADGKAEAELLEIAETVICESVDFITEKTKLGFHETFLRRIARRSSRKPRVKLFTTNYDNCFEEAAARSGFMVVDGFSFGSDGQFNPDQFNFDVVRRSSDERADYVENLFHLFKIHGSIDWEWNEATGSIRKSPGTKKPVLIYPRSTKYEMSFSQPYVDMMAHFQSTLRVSNTTLLVLGFGFNDKHIAEPIISAVRSNLSFSMIVVDPQLGNKCEKGHHLENEYLTNISSYIDSGDGRFALLEAKFEDIIPLIPDMVAETELERHQDRMRKGTKNA
ncbi:hypothetical protein DK26_19205 [Bosea sp. WAO]|uniref:SIR2 family protein n=1 Tax=Bosea sp. WAO TaxID=406341 RepID=UPI00074A274D|nr:SIR2 family protein [Bosea sp. WAO]KUL93888.1 hypothetical protein DK26_19205 [Bosea sp. WAO]